MHASLCVVALHCLTLLQGPAGARAARAMLEEAKTILETAKGLVETGGKVAESARSVAESLSRPWKG